MQNISWVQKFVRIVVINAKCVTKTLIRCVCCNKNSVWILKLDYGHLLIKDSNYDVFCRFLCHKGNQAVK